jgi:hypothetical protein
MLLLIRQVVKCSHWQCLQRSHRHQHREEPRQMAVVPICGQRLHLRNHWNLPSPMSHPALYFQEHPAGAVFLRLVRSADPTLCAATWPRHFPVCREAPGEAGSQCIIRL